MRAIRRALLALCAGAALAAIVGVAGPEPAEALCSGTGSDDTYWHWLYGKETGREGTCDNDRYYRGAVAEHDQSQGDGYCAVVRARSNSGSWSWQGYSCRNDSRYVTYNWNVGTTSGDAKICKHWRSWDCTTPQRSWAM